MGAVEDPAEEDGGDEAGGVGGGVHEAGYRASRGAADVRRRGPGRAEIEIDGPGGTAHEERREGGFGVPDAQSEENGGGGKAAEADRRAGLARAEAAGENVREEAAGPGGGDAEEEREAGVVGRFRQRHASLLAEIGGEPGDVELPEKGRAEGGSKERP